MPITGAVLQREKAREQLEADLLEILRCRRSEWMTATDDDRDYARQRFLLALQNFNSCLLDLKPPE
jgi:hypothetical protein